MSPFHVMPKSVIDDIHGYSTDTEKNKAYADYFVTIFPHASWYYLTGLLYYNTELAAARESKSFMSNGNSTINNN